MSGDTSKPLVQRVADPQPTLAMSTFLLSTLLTTSARHTHLKHLLSLDSPYIVLVDRATPVGWEAISEAREFILSDQASSPGAQLHLIAPCPHEETCPFVGGRDKCSFSQRVQRTGFMRKTKHSSKGEEDVNYTYLVIGRGERPSSTPSSTSATSRIFGEIGRVGGIGREELEKDLLKYSGKTELREVEGGDYEMVSLADEAEATLAARKLAEEELDLAGSANGQGLEASLAKEAYQWPRVVAPPLKRSGHVILDTCFPDGKSVA